MPITHKPTLDVLAAGLERNGIESLEALAVKARCEPDDVQSLSAALNVLDYGRYLAEAREAVEYRMDELKIMLRAGAERSLSVSFMAEAGGVTRQTVYDTLAAGKERYPA